MNLKKLLQNNKLVAPWRAKYSEPGDPSGLIDIVLNTNNNTIVFVFEAAGVTEATNHLYFIEFRNIKWIPDDEFDYDLEDQYYSVSSNGQLYWVLKHKMTNTVRVACSCSDYYFTFAWWNYKRQCHYGKKPLPYIRKTPLPPVGREFRNPQKLEGCCKHLSSAIIELLELDFLTDK